MAVSSKQDWDKARSSWQSRRQDETLKERLTELQYKKFESLIESEKIEAIPLIKELIAAKLNTPSNDGNAKEKGQLIPDEEFGSALKAAQALAQFKKIVGKSESLEVPYYSSSLALNN